MPLKNGTTTVDESDSPQRSLEKEQVTVSKDVANFDELSSCPAAQLWTSMLVSHCVRFELALARLEKGVYNCFTWLSCTAPYIFFFVSSQNKIVYISSSCARHQMVRIYLFRPRPQIYL